MFADNLASGSNRYRSTKEGCGYLSTIYKGVIPSAEDLREPMEGEVLQAQQMI